MANLDAKSGFNPIGKMGSGPPQKMNDYSAVAGYTTVMFQGDLVKLNAGNIEQSAAGDDSNVGVFWGSTFTDSNGKPAFKNTRPASTAATCFVYDDPYQVFEVQGDAGSTQANLGAKANIVVAAGNSTTGISGMEVASAGFGGAGNDTILCVGFSKKEGRDEVGSNNLLYNVLIAGHTYK